MDINFAPDCVPAHEQLCDIAGSLLALDFGPTTISFRRTRSFPPLTQDYTGRVLFRIVGRGGGGFITRAVGMFGTFRQLDPPMSGNFPWYAVRD
jgi:hypothetical protein